MPAKILAPSAKSDKVAPLSVKSKPIQKPGSFSYALYLHREELRKRKISATRISRTKLLLTHELITKTVMNINKCSPDDLQMLSRETVFKKNLHRHILIQKQQQHMEMMRLQQQQQRHSSMAKENIYPGIAQQHFQPQQYRQYQYPYYRQHQYQRQQLHFQQQQQPQQQNNSSSSRSQLNQTQQNGQQYGPHKTRIIPVHMY